MADLFGQILGVANQRQQGQMEGQSLIQKLQLQAAQAKDQARTRSLADALQQAQTKNYERQSQIPLPGSPEDIARQAALAAQQEERERKRLGLQHDYRMQEIGVEQAGANSRAQISAGKPKTPPRPTEIATRASLVYPRAAEAAQTLERFYTSGAPLKSKASQIPIVGNYLMSDDEQQLNQAAETVASAILRLESGAAVTQNEVRSYAKQFIPQPGEGANVLAQKRATLRTQLEQMRRVASGASGGGEPEVVATPARQTSGAALSDADLWESYVNQGLTPGQATAKVKARKR